jgi:hypothetical protein
MFAKSRSLRWFLAAVLVVAAVSVLAGCASAGSGDAPATAAADVPPAAPPRKPFVPPAWEAKEYANEQYGFSVHYPADFEEQAVQAGGLFTAASPMQAPRLDVTASPPPGDGSVDAVAASIEATLKTVGGGEAKVTEKKAVKLRDEATPAMEFAAEWTFQGIPLLSSAVATVRDGELITVMVTGMQGTAITELSDIAYTLYFDE